MIVAKEGSHFHTILPARHTYVIPIMLILGILESYKSSERAIIACGIEKK